MQQLNPKKHLLLICSSCLITIITYLFLIWKYFPLDPNSGWAVFLTPRWFGGMNDLPSSSFSQWRELILILTLIGLYIRYIHPKVVVLPFRRFLIVAYVLTFTITFLFVLLTSNGVNQYVIQAKSVNNGIVYSIGYLIRLPEFLNLSVGGKLQFIFSSLGSNDSGYTIPGTTHPPASFLIFFVIAGLAKILAFGSNEISHLMIAWSLVVTVLNCTLVPLILLITSKILGESGSKRSLLYLLSIPSITFHICAMGEIFGSIALLTALYLLIKLISKLEQKTNNIREEASLLLSAGTCFVVQAQISYSQLIPIFSFGLILIPFLLNRGWLRLLFGISLVTLPFMVYTLIEVTLSQGQSVYLIRAFESSQVVHEMLAARPNPQAQVANWVIMSVFGGLLFLPTIIKLGGEFRSIFKGYWNATTTVEEFLKSGTLIALLLLAINGTARMEVERVWHWFFVLVWILASVTMARLHTYEWRIRTRQFNLSNLVAATQMIVSLMLAMVLQDYY